MEERERVYGAEPEVKNWIKKKKMIFRFMAAYWILHAVLSIAALQQMGAGFQVVTDVLRPLFQLFWISVFISPYGTWRINLIFYFWAFCNLAINWNNYAQNLQGHLPEIVQQMPLLGVVFAMECLVPLLFLGIACYLTFSKTHRELSDRAQEIQRELAEYAKALSSKS